MKGILGTVCLKVGKVLKAYAKSLFPVVLYTILASRTVGTTIVFDHSFFTIYFILSWLFVYPFVANQIPTWIQRLGQNRSNVAMKLHNSDLKDYDRGSNWRVAHTRVSYLPIKTTSPSIGRGAWLIRQMYCFVLITFAPLILIKRLL